MSARARTLVEMAAVFVACTLLFHWMLSVQPFVLDVDDVEVAGYLFMPIGRVNASVTVLWPVGSCATPESSYWQVAAPLLETDTACAVFAPNSEQSVRAVVAWARQQPGVDHLLEATPVPATRRPDPTFERGRDGDRARHG